MTLAENASVVPQIQLQDYLIQLPTLIGMSQLPGTLLESRSSWGYTRLNPARHEIRLLSLCSGNIIEDVHCKFFTVSLEDYPQYEALSYFWGDPNNTQTVVLNCRLRSVTTNLESALRRLRRQDGEQRILWVDALCINQDDIAERNQQVSNT